MKSIFAFFQRYPIVGVIALLALLGFVQAPQLLQDLRINKYYGEIEETTGKAVRFIERAGRRGPHCSADMKIDGTAQNDVQIDCNEATDPGVEIPLVKYDGRWISQEFVKGSNWFSLGLVLAELFGVLYYARLLLIKKAV